MKHGYIFALCLAACAAKAPPRRLMPSVRALSAAERRVWDGYLASIDAFLAMTHVHERGATAMELRARLFENLASVQRSGVELPRAQALRAALLLRRLEELFEQRVSRKSAPEPKVSEGEEAPAAAPDPAPAPAPAEAAPNIEISESEVDDGGPPVDIALPPANPRAFFRWPVLPVRVTSSFGYRKDPISGRVGFHDGLDLSAPRGTVVLTAAPGQVTYAGRRGGSGNLVVISHGPGLETVYAHLDRILAPRGRALGAGEVVGLVGSTGRSTGPHLHFVVRVRQKPVNPLSVVGQAEEPLAAR
jgi:murein DD-endopeptidase MepM/ murein hydrolase activator NlpD